MSDHDSPHPPGEHDSELPDEDDAAVDDEASQQGNAETSLDQPSS